MPDTLQRSSLSSLDGGFRYDNCSRTADMTVQDIVDRVAGSWFGPFNGTVVSLLARCAYMGAIEPLMRRFEVQKNVPQSLQTAVKDFIDTDRWRVPLFVQLSSLPAFTIPVLYATAGGSMDEMAWIVFLSTSLPVALYNASKAYGASNPFEAQPHVLIEWLSFLVRVFCAMLVIYRIREYHKSEEWSTSSSDTEVEEEEEEGEGTKGKEDAPGPSDSNFMTPVSRLIHMDPDY